MTEFTPMGHLPPRKGHALQDRPTVGLASTRLELAKLLVEPGKDQNPLSGRFSGRSAQPPVLARHDSMLTAPCCRIDSSAAKQTSNTW